MNWTKKYIPYYGILNKDIPHHVVDNVSCLVEKRHSVNPLLSIVLIAHNEESHILSCIWSLCDNTCDLPLEIIVINNNSTDETEDILKRINVRYYNEQKKGPGFARQKGLDHAKGKYYICIDADTIYPPNYLSTHIKQLQKPKVVATYSLWSFMPDENHSAFGLLCYEFLRDIYLKVQSLKRPELCVRGMTFAFKTQIARQYGFRTDIKRGEDGYLALMLKSNGKLKFITSYKARVLTGNSTLSTDGSLSKSFKKRLVKALKNISGLVTSKKNYKDDNSNLL